jgi:malate dehydrogenase
VTTAAIIGAGELGGAVAQALAAREAVNRIVLIDPAVNAAAGKALDIQQMGAISGFHTRLAGSGDLTDAIGCGVCVIAEPFRVAAPQSTDEDVEPIRSLTQMLRDVPLVFAGDRHAGLMLRAVRDARSARQRVMGSSAEAFASAIRAIVALEARCAPNEVMLSILGAPPNGFVVPWSEATVGGYLLERVLTPVQLARLQGRVANLWPPRAQALGLAAALVAESVIHSARRAVHVLAVLDGEFGVRGGVSAVPAFVGTTGIVGTRSPSLSTRERVQLETALGMGIRDL